MLSPSPTQRTNGCCPGRQTHSLCTTSLDARPLPLCTGPLPPPHTPRLLRAGGSHDPPLFVQGIKAAQSSECLHGVQSGCVQSGGRRLCPTSFPNGGALGATFNRTLWLHVGDVIGKERRAINNVLRKPSGLACWSPDINTFRDPRWGRGQEVCAGPRREFGVVRLGVRHCWWTRPVVTAVYSRTWPYAARQCSRV